MTNQTMEEKAANYLKGIIKNCLANNRKLNPCDISDEEVEAVYTTNSLPGYKLHQEKVAGYVNNKKVVSIVTSIIDIKQSIFFF